MTQDDITYETRKFTMTNTISKQIDELAENHSGGNASQLVRSAIKDHARTLEGHDEFELKKLHHQVQQTAENVNKLLEITKDNSRSASSQSPSESTKPREDSTNNADIQRKVQKYF